MLIKVTSFHVYTHQDNTVDTIENCSICDLAVQNQNSEFTFVAILMLVLLSVIIFTGKKLSPLVFEAPSFYFQYAIFGRPPPFN
ncbi:MULTISPECIES: hypothetical protein [Maribacter]|jgi:hypothetical protein|uniref:Uncharacterized protein n=2 Tax=Maribacter stanieri TaxID=440514 RepID=A0A1I6K019_9FLAO|nr:MULTISPECIES: hypothetical protein [Maribacter]SFR84537.1 hypothetical protein SAMN04488010_3305 [Maribacter stanieri]|tara:strand:+ start:402 stop:653 length:252 start_codon:yes stop_codon:yes gene_type:complete